MIPGACLEWDSAFFGVRIGRLHAHRLTEDALLDVRAWVGAERIGCLYFLGDTGDFETCRIASDNGFRLVGVRVEFERQVEALGDLQSDGQTSVRPFAAEDLDSLIAISKGSFRDTRFHQDPGFPDARCDDLYQVWVEKSCHGYADIVLVATLGQTPAGYITIHREDGGKGRIGLTAVDIKARGEGVGRRLLSRALTWCLDEGLTHISVATQGSNIPAQRLYQSCGFQTKGLRLWYHWWPTEGRSQKRCDDGEQV